MFSANELREFNLVRGKTFERPTARWGGMYHQGPPDGVVVVGTEVGVVPIEAVLIFCGEAVGEVGARKNGILGQDMSYFQVYRM